MKTPFSHLRLDSRRLAHGGAAPVFIILLALIISALVFFFYTRPKLEKKDETVSSELIKSPETGSEKTASMTTTPSVTAPMAPPVAAPAPTTPSFGFARPLDLGKEMVRSLAAGDFSRVGSMAAAADPTQAQSAATMFEKLIKTLGAKLGSEDQVELIGMVENKTRLAIPFTLPGKPDILRLQMDLERDERMGWKITRLELPKEATAALPSTPQPAMAAVSTTSEPGAPAMTPKPKSLFAVADGVDALTFGSDFVRALLTHDFATARKMVDEKKVPTERLAGLCIVFEEGQYEFKPSKPLIITVANPEVSWVVAQVQSQVLQQTTEFGLELQRSGVDQPWRVVGMNLSEILSSFAASASKMGVPYTPIVTNPTGGESLALYFEYDQAALHPRAQKQLDIVASLLKSDPNKKLHIAGHTDDKGTDDYNLNLSRARAETVKVQLVALGVPEAQVITTALGKAQPLSPNQKADGTDDPSGRSKNRRAEIFLDF
ncbi:MAG: OmpA family protein [Verrucomicrobia bacterium]|nr:OmpA family protein [Verrucomicrobiota bacterium]